MDLATYNAVRQRSGMEPVDKLPDGVNQETDSEATGEVNKDNDIVDPPIAANTPATNPPAKEEPKTIPPVQSAKPDLSVEELIALLKEKGHEIDLNPKKETEEEKQARREAEKMAWAYANKKISAKEHAGYNADSVDVHNLYYREYLAEQKAEDSTLTDADIFDEFQTKYGLNAAVDSRQFKTGQKLLDKLGNQLLKEKYPNVFELESNYSQYEAGENSRKDQENKIRQEAPKYKSTIEDIFTKELTSYNLKVGDTDYSIPYPEDAINNLKSHFSDPNEAMKYIQQGLSKDALAMAARMSIIEATLPHLLESFGKQFLDNHKKGIKGISTEISNVHKSNKIKQTSEQIAAIRRFNPSYEPADN